MESTVWVPTCLEEYKVSIGQAAAVQPRPITARIRIDHTLSIVEELGQPLFEIDLGPLFGLGDLLLVRGRDGNGVMSIMKLIDEPVQEGENYREQVVKPCCRGLSCGGEIELRSDVSEDGRDLGKEDVAVD